jgi:hypothetical protein
VFSVVLPLARAAFAPVLPASTVTSGAAIAVCFTPEEDCAAFAIRAIPRQEQTRRNPDGATHRRSLLPIYFAAEFAEAAFDFPGRALANSVNVFILSRSGRLI